MVHFLTPHFGKLIQNIQPSSERLELAETLPQQVRDYLAGNDEFVTRSPHSRLVGSYAQHLTVGDVKDVDFLVRVDGDPEVNEPTVRTVLSELASALRDLPEHLGYSGDTYFDITRNRRSVQVKFEYEDFYLDVVPCIAPNNFGDSIFVPDWGFKKWIESHPRGVVRLIEELDDKYNKKFRGLVKLFKHFRNNHMTYMKPKSYWLVAMAIEAVESNDIDMSEPVAAAFDQLLNHLYDKYHRTYLRTDGTVPRIKDPMLGHNVAWNWERSHFEAFMRRLEDGKGWSGRALDHYDKAEAIKLWQNVFGEEFPTNIDDHAKSHAASRQPGSAYATPTGLILPGAAPALKSTPVQPTRYYGGSLNGKK